MEEICCGIPSLTDYNIRRSGFYIPDFSGLPPADCSFGISAHSRLWNHVTALEIQHQRDVRQREAEKVLSQNF